MIVRRTSSALRCRRRAAFLNCGVALLLLTTACSDDDGDRMSVRDVDETSVGTCLLFGAEVGAEVTTLPVVPCGESHSHEIFAVITSQNESDVYPGFEALESEAQTGCFAAFEPYVGIDFFDSDLNYSWMVPTLTSWDRDDDREIICVIANHNGAPLVGSARDARR